MKKQLGFYVDQQHCSGCSTCQTACKDKHDLPVGQLFRHVTEFSGGGFIKKGAAVIPHIYAYWLSLSCNHCEDPICVKNCPTKAMQKRPEDGIVFVDQDKCIGCKYCVMSCPYGAPQFNSKTGKTNKCDLCRDYLAEGKSPACVASCPMRALHFGPIDELRQKYGKVDQIRGMPSPDKTNPSLVIQPHAGAEADQQRRE